MTSDALGAAISRSQMGTQNFAWNGAVESEVRKARDELAVRITDRVRADGSVQDRCQSRVIETALFRRLLRQLQLHQGIADRLTRHLQQANPATGFEQIVQDAALGRLHDQRTAADFLAEFRHFTGQRKQLLLASVIGLVAGSPGAAGMSARGVSYGTHAVWTDLTLCAIRILDDHTHGRQVVTDQKFLIRTLRGCPMPGPWQGNLLAHLLALHALATFAPDGELMREGVSSLLGQVNPDGGIPFISGQDIWISALTGMSLCQAGTTPDVTETIGDFIAEHQLPDGGWGYDCSTTQSDVDDASRCVILLQTLDRSRHAHSVRRGTDYLLGMAGPDGGFPTYVCGDRSEADLTAGAVIALAGHPSRSRQVLGGATGFLVSAQHEDGAFDTSWTLSRSSVIAHVLQAFRTAGEATATGQARTERAIGKAVAFLVGQQNPDGGWAQEDSQPSDVLSTAHALAALPGGTALRRGVAYLLGSQNADGGFTSIADQVGPRPIPYDFPVLTEVHVLSALNHVLALSTGASPNLSHQKCGDQ